MTNEPELLPCPFCGSKAYLSQNSDNGWPQCVECDNEDCEATGPWGKRHDSHAQAMERIVSGWNRRVTSATLSESKGAE